MLLDHIDMSAFSLSRWTYWTERAKFFLFSSLLPYTMNKNIEEIKRWCQKSKINKEEMANVTYRVKTQANMRICHDGKFGDIYKSGEEMLRKETLQYKINIDKHKPQFLQFIMCFLQQITIFHRGVLTEVHALVKPRPVGVWVITFSLSESDRRTATQWNQITQNRKLIRIAYLSEETMRMFLLFTSRRDAA